ncbi:hypothetical protein O3G_MSEX014873 [Manduca sexta]|uniref:Uncharacterized protein n=1 Tax=Manduca sexta TaxID=7130 RepID=A0A922D2W7_MANSE|nr:hypothetical protein O3G_MSEX014873 [Manduca sexta]
MKGITHFLLVFILYAMLSLAKGRRFFAFKNIETTSQRVVTESELWIYFRSGRTILI